MTTTAGPTHVPQLRLPGQAAAHEGPVDMTMMYLMHHAFRRDLATFAAASAVTPVEDRGAWVAMVERWSLLATSLHHHHLGEDTWLWPALMERVTAEERATLEAMEAEHGEIDPALEACAAGLARLAEHADPDARAALTVRLTAAKASLSRHLHHEETETIALIQRELTQADWEAIDAHFKESVTFGEVVRLVPWVLHQVPAEVRTRLFAEPGGRMHQLVWVLTRRRFERLDRRAFHHLEG
jgi:iron-sulfur cluster repair protein YtfE (RIC family)